MMTATYVLHVVAFVCFVLAAARWWEQYHLVALGLALWMLSLPLWEAP